jgi:CBS domain-containing protein
MPQTVRDVMTSNLLTVPLDSTLVEAARSMRDADIGSVLVMDGDRLHGIVTDRDLVLRGLAEGQDPFATSVGQVCTSSLTTVGPSESVEAAVEAMRRDAVGRLPVVEDGRPVGIVTAGDLAAGADARTLR